MNILTKNTKVKGNIPKDIMLIKKIIESEGIEEYEKNTLNYISEFLNLYITDLLEDSMRYAKMCDRPIPDLEDIKLAVKLKKENNISKAPSSELMNSISSSINNKPFPNIQSGICQLNLPSLESTQLKNNFHIYSEEIVKNIEKNVTKANNWFYSTKIENYTRIKQKGLSLAKKRIDPIPSQKSNNKKIDGEVNSQNSETKLNKKIYTDNTQNNSKFKAPLSTSGIINERKAKLNTNIIKEQNIKLNNQNQNNNTLNNTELRLNENTMIEEEDYDN